MSAETLEAFKKNTENHSLEVLKDDGLYRHLYLSNSGKGAYHFHITTWPGYLCICGDMGDFLFSRTRDMFEFFRTREDLSINPRYWAEKLQAGASTPDRCLYMEWDEDAFRAAIKDRFDNWVESDEPDERTREDVEYQIEIEVLHKAEFEEAACVAVSEFHHADASDLFQDFLIDLGTSCHQYTHHYIWCCYAVVWAIQQYDQEKARGE